MKLMPARIGAEGNPIRLGERRTMSFANRKIIIGSTPLYADTSAVLRAYAESDGRVFEVPCPACGGLTEIMWMHIEWEPGRPNTTAFRCPHCGELIAERHKAAMVAAGAWRATRPEVRGHAGFRLNALVSLLVNASWGKLAAEFLAAREDPAELMVFTNTILAEGWREAASEIDESALASRVEPFDLDSIPAEVLVVTIGADVQDDRIEATVVGWTRTGEALVLAHFVIWGSFQDQSTWDEFDELLRTRWKHPFGGMLKVDAAVVDAGDGDHYDAVLNFCAPRISRRVFAGKGVYGSRPGFALAKKGKVGGRLAIVGVDVLKTAIFDRLQRGRSIRFSHTLEPVYFEQLAAEKRIVRYKRGRPVRRFERVSQRARAEALDALVYAFAARQAVNTTFDRREAELRGNVERKSIASQLAR
jgi:phage terminase large subunit GpA-like protein